MGKREASKVEKLEAISVDVTHSIFENEYNDRLYVVRDIFAAETVFVFALEAHSYSILIREDHCEFDLEQGFKHENRFQSDRKEKFKDEIRRIIENWYEL